MGFLKPKAPKLTPPKPQIMTPEPFDPSPAQAVRPDRASYASGDSRVGTATGTSTLINQLAPRSDRTKKRTLIGGAYG